MDPIENETIYDMLTKQYKCKLLFKDLNGSEKMEKFNTQEEIDDEEEVYEIYFFRTSAKTGQNVNLSTSGLTKHIIQQK